MPSNRHYSANIQSRSKSILALSQPQRKIFFAVLKAIIFCELERYPYLDELRQAACELEKVFSPAPKQSRRRGKKISLAAQALKCNRARIYYIINTHGIATLVTLLEDVGRADLYGTSWKMILAINLPPGEYLALY